MATHYHSLLNRILLKFQAPSSIPIDDPAQQEIYAKIPSSLSAVLFKDDQLWLAADETCTLECFTLTDNHRFTQHQHFPLSQFIDLPESADQEIDIEGLDYADYYLWVIGSHSYKRKPDKPDKSVAKNIDRLSKVESERNRYLLARIPLVNGQLHKSCAHPDRPDQQLTAARLKMANGKNVLLAALTEDQHLKPFIQAEIPGKDNGFDIEGLLVAKNRIFLGLRGPVLRGWAMILEIELEATSENRLQLKAIGDRDALYKKHFVDLQGLGIRDLGFYHQDLIILAGPTMDLDGPVRLYSLASWLEASEQTNLWRPQRLFDLPFGEGNDHAEGFTFCPPLAIGESPAILVVYDSPAPERLAAGEYSVLADVFQLT